MHSLPRFTVRHLLLATTVVALVFAAMRWSVSWGNLDPDSEQFVALGTEHRLRWNRVPWDRAKAEMIPQLAARFQAAARPSCPAPIYLDQELFQLSYSNYAGRRVHTVRVDVRGECNADRSESSFGVFEDGGGSFDGACQVVAEYDDATGILRVGLRQLINSRRSAREAELVYAYDGSEFRLLESESALMAVGVSGD